NLHPLEVKLLRAFGTQPLAEWSEKDLAQEAGITEAQHRRAVELLVNRKLVVRSREKIDEGVALTETGMGWAEAGLPEVRVLRAVIQSGETTVGDLKGQLGLEPTEVGPAVGALKKSGALEIGPGGILRAVPEKAEVYERLQTFASELASGVDLPLKGLEAPLKILVEQRVRRRGRDKGAFRILTTTLRWYRLAPRGEEAAQELVNRGVTGEEVTALTPQMLRDGSWRGRAFRRFNLNLAPPRLHAGRKHPYRSYLDWVKGKLLAMGFQEMTGSLVEPEFWNMDALFMPQFHASREIHDIYRIRAPRQVPSLPSPYVERVTATHTDGWETGGRGWGYAFDESKARRNVLRSQGTVLSVRQLASKPRIPGKYFAMARCFRPDRVDATHAMDFFQVEGIVLGEDVTFLKLLDLLRLFALEIAKSDELRFVPDYFPFTEPSVEVSMKHPRIGWTELGGAGIFRREVTKPMGIDVPVAAWGLGLDRMAMVALGIDDIRDLFSRDLNRIREMKVKL
ncbi:MAG: phenylalanine--tRNA ligase subunit alpha, partial [Planctomycetota bacterium]